MKSVRGARVIVVDDKEAEALPLLKALARKGVATAFFHVTNTTSFRQLSPRLQGVRLAILDMDLVEGGAGPEAKASTLANVLRRILDDKNGPYGVLAWTFHDDLVDHFHHYVFADPNFPKPVFTVRVPKSKFQSASSKKIIRLAALTERVEAELRNNSPLRVFQEWEQSSSAAATAVTNTLTELAAPPLGDPDQWRTQWNTDVLRILYALARARAEKTLEAATSIDSLCSALAPVHGDRLEALTPDLTKSLRTHSKQIFDASADCGPLRKAKINAMLHVGGRRSRGLAAGNLYAFRSTKRPGWAPKPAEFLRPMMRQLATTHQTDLLLNQISAVTVPILVEASAACDYAQRKILMARFICGLLVPEIHRPSLKDESQSLWRLGPVFLDEPLAPAGSYFMYLSSQQVVSLSLKKVMEMRTAGQLRTQALADAQVWFSQQAGRQGKMVLN
jgi:hypothetical protein